MLCRIEQSRVHGHTLDLAGDPKSFNEPTAGGREQAHDRRDVSEGASGRLGDGTLESCDSLDGPLILDRSPHLSREGRLHSAAVDSKYTLRR
jgi:hypothetical protein